MNDKWIPDVGQIVNVRTGLGTYRKAEIQHICNNRATVLFENDPEPSLIHFVDLRPIQTEADKYRDEQIDKLKWVITLAGGYFEDKFVDEVYRLGCRILSDDERIVKPLTDEQMISCTRQYQQGFDDLALHIGYAVQRELGIGE